MSDGETPTELLQRAFELTLCESMTDYRSSPEGNVIRYGQVRRMTFKEIEEETIKAMKSLPADQIRGWTGIVEPVSLELRKHSFVRMWHRLIAKQFDVSPEDYDKVEVAWPTVIFTNWFYVTVMYLLDYNVASSHRLVLWVWALVAQK